MAELTHRYAGRGAAREVFRRREGEVLLSGPAGTGKSRAALEKLLAVMVKYPESKGLIVRKVRSTLGATALDTWRRFVVPEMLAARTMWYFGGSNDRPPHYELWNGSRILIGGMDDPIKVMSADYDMIYAQEATELRVEDWEALTTRLRNGRVPYQQLLADCNPDAPHHWLYQRVQRGKTVMLESRHEDNPVLFDDNGVMTDLGRDYIGKLDDLTGVRRERLRYGRWVAAEGIVYEDWDPAVHLVQPFEIPDSWQRYWAVDFGYTNPFVCQWWAEDPDGRLFLYREIYRTRRTTDEHAADILARVSVPDVGERYGRRWREPKPVAIICDHDAEDRAILERELGLPTMAADKRVQVGIQAVQRRLRRAGDGKPRLFAVRGCGVGRDPELEAARRPCSTEEEMVSYIWAPGVDGRPIKEEPLKKDDHGMDAMRYLVMSRDEVARPRYRSFSVY